METDIMMVVAIFILIGSFFFYFWRSSQGYFDNYGRKIPLDEIKTKNEQHDSEIVALKAQLEEQNKKLEETSNTSGSKQLSEILEKLASLEQRLETLEKKVS